MALQPQEIQALQAAAQAGNEAGYWEVKNRIMTPLREQVARAIAGNQGVEQIRVLTNEIAKLEDEIARQIPASIRVDSTLLVNAIKNARQTRNINEVTRLINAGANVCAQNGEGDLPLFAALNIHNDNPQMSVMICQALTNRGANWDQKPNLDLIYRDERQRAKKISPRVLASVIGSEDLLSVMRNHGIQPVPLPLPPHAPQGQQGSNPPQYQPQPQSQAQDPFAWLRPFIANIQREDILTDQYIVEGMNYLKQTYPDERYREFRESLDLYTLLFNEQKRRQAQRAQYQPQVQQGFAQGQQPQYQQPQVQQGFAQGQQPQYQQPQVQQGFAQQGQQPQYQQQPQVQQGFVQGQQAQYQQPDMQVLMTAIEYGNLIKIRELLDYNPRLVNQTYNSITPLIYAYQKNQLGVAIELLQRGADISFAASQARDYSLATYVGGPAREPLKKQEEISWKEAQQRAELVASWIQNYEYYRQNAYSMSNEMLNAVIRHLSQQGPSYYPNAESERNFLSQIQQQRQYAASQAGQYQQGAGPSQPSGPSQPLGGRGGPPMSAEQIQRREEAAKLEAELERLKKLQKEQAEFEQRQQAGRRGVEKGKKEEHRPPVIIGKKGVEEKNVERVHLKPLLNAKQFQYVSKNIDQIAWLVKEHVKQYPGLSVSCNEIRIRLEGGSAKAAAEDLKSVLAVLIQSKMEEDAKKQKREGPR